MKTLNQTIIVFIISALTAHAGDVVFYETVPTYGKFIIMAVSIGIPTFIILSHIPLFELLDTDKIPEPPKLPRAQEETLRGTIVGTVFGLLITVLCLILL